MTEIFNRQCASRRRPQRCATIVRQLSGRLHATLFDIEMINPYATSVERVVRYHSAVYGKRKASEYL
ncbi:MAG: hypothetical protein J5732_02705 [Bacteroidaceae bacterium]|nr:hypothetical protein [Bacteroidaceae bacterium]